MKKFINVSIGGLSVLSIEVEESAAKCISRTGNCVLFCKDHWYVTLIAYLAFKNIPPCEFNEGLSWDKGDREEHYQAVSLLYRDMTYDDMRKLKLIFGEDGFYFRGDYHGCGHIEVICKIEFQKD